MSAPKSAYAQALVEAKRVGASRCSDAATMATYCESALQIMVGAASPQLVWEGAQKKGDIRPALPAFLQVCLALASGDLPADSEIAWAALPLPIVVDRTTARGTVHARFEDGTEVLTDDEVVGGPYIRKRIESPRAELAWTPGEAAQQAVILLAARNVAERLS